MSEGDYSDESGSQEPYYSDEETQIKLNISREKVDEIIQKAKQIVTWFKKQDFLRIFKECYENQSIFFNKLKTIASSQVENGDEGWITNSKQPENKKNKTKKEQKQTNMEDKFKNYSFLTDKKLLKRIGGQDNYDMQQHKTKERKTNEKNYHQDKQYRQQREVKQSKAWKQDRRESNREYKKQKEYKNTQKSTSQKNQRQQIEHPRKYREQIKYVEKPSQQKIEKPQEQEKQIKKQNQIKNHHKEEQIEIENKQGNKQVVQKSLKSQHQPEENKSKIQVSRPELNKTVPASLQSVPSTFQQSKNQTFSIPKKQQKKQQDVVNQKQQKAKLVAEPPTKKQQCSMGPQMSTNVRLNFQRVCKQNPYILSFIAPVKTVQKIEYVLDNKKISNVKVRVISDID